MRNGDSPREMKFFNAHGSIETASTEWGWHAHEFQGTQGLKSFLVEYITGDNRVVQATNP